MIRLADGTRVFGPVPISIAQDLDLPSIRYVQIQVESMQQTVTWVYEIVSTTLNGDREIIYGTYLSGGNWVKI